MAAPNAHERHPIYMCEMMQRLGIEPGGGVVPSLSLSYATALRCCEACPSKQVCRDWLDGMLASVAFAPRFARTPRSSLNCRLINLARGLIDRAVEANYHQSARWSPKVKCRKSDRLFRAAQRVTCKRRRGDGRIAPIAR